jgi:hypothetical protein
MPELHSPPSLDALPWNRILRDIHNHQVLPIIGPGLVTVEHNGVSMPFTDWLAPDFTCRLGLVPEEGMTLNRAACAHLVNQGKRKDIYEELRELVEQHEDLPIPPGLADLAAIRDFDLFITSTFDGFLTKALRQARPGWKPDERGLAAFHPNKPVDLPDPLPGTFAYHVLGAWNTYPDFAVWEEDYMEFLCGLLEAPKDTQKNLLRVLKNRSLLLIGAPFGDWIVRFFLRVAKQGRLSELKNTADYLADSPHLLGEPMVFYFDKVIGSPRIISTEPAAFAAELRRRWAEKYEATSADDLLASIPDDMERGSVFISYAHEDLASAAALASGLKAAGIPVWLDRRRLNPGGDWEQALKRAVKSRASLFLSLISAATEQGNPDRFVHKERLWAAEVHVPGEIFYLPIFIDATITAAREPEVFAPLHRHPLPGGIVTPDFASLLRRYLDQYQQNGEVRDV